MVTQDIRQTVQDWCKREAKLCLDQASAIENSGLACPRGFAERQRAEAKALMLVATRLTTAASDLSTSSQVSGTELIYNHITWPMLDHLACYGKFWFDWRWTDICRIGVYAYGGSDQSTDPVLQSISIETEIKNTWADHAWRVYLGPMPTIEFVREY